MELITNPVPWPNGARCAVAITYDLDADSLIHIAKPNTADTYLSTQSLLRYGAEVALPRICRIYEHFGLKQTFFMPAWCVERYPAAVELILKGGHEIGHHGYIHESYNQQTKDDETYWFEKAIRVYEKHLGYRPRGIRTPLNEFSKYTLDNLIEAGIEYDSSLMGDDVPYILASRNRPGSVLEIPQFIANDDYPQFMHNWDFGNRDDDPAAQPGEGRLSRRVRSAVRIARNVAYGLASIPERTDVACQNADRNNRIHNVQRRCLVRHHGRNQRSRSGVHCRRNLGSKNRRPSV